MFIWLAFDFWKGLGLFSHSIQFPRTLRTQCLAETAMVSNSIHSTAFPHIRSLGPFPLSRWVLFFRFGIMDGRNNCSPGRSRSMPAYHRGKPPCASAAARDASMLCENNPRAISCDLAVCCFFIVVFPPPICYTVSSPVRVRVLPIRHSPTKPHNREARTMVNVCVCGEDGVRGCAQQHTRTGLNDRLGMSRARRGSGCVKTHPETTRALDHTLSTFPTGPTPATRAPKILPARHKIRPPSDDPAQSSAGRRTANILFGLIRCTVFHEFFGTTVSVCACVSLRVCCW